MSYADIVEVLARVTTDTTEVETAQQAVDRLSRDWTSTRDKIVAQLPRVASLVNRLLYATKRVMHHLNMSMDPLVDAIISGAMSIIAAAVAMQHSFAAMGPVGWALLAVNAVLLFLATAEATFAIAQAAQAKIDAAKANASVQMITDIVIEYRGMMGGMY